MSADQASAARRRVTGATHRDTAVWSVVHDFVTARRGELARPLRVLDLGGGTGGLAVSLAGEGHHVVVIDPSPDALASLRRRADEAGVADRIVAVQGDADSVERLAAETGGGQSLDVICCHGALEMVADPAAAVAAMARVLPPGGALSLVVAQRLAAVFSRALAGQFDRARHILDRADGRWGDDDPMPRRFDRSEVEEMARAAGFAIVAVQGVRPLGDLVPSAHLDSESARSALADLEAALTTHPQFPFLGQLGALVHVLGRKR